MEVKNYTDFMCSCEHNKEEVQKCNECLERVYEDLTNEKHKCTAESLLSDVVYSLQWGLDNEEHYEASIAGIGCDMWCGISANVRWYHPENKGDTKVAIIYVQCDEVEHGLARVWELAKEAVKEHKENKNG